MMLSLINMKIDVLLCDQYVKTEDCGFNNCQYGYTGVMLQRNGEAPKKVTSQEQISVGNHYKQFDPKVTGTADWLSLKIVTQDLFSTEEMSPIAVCGICQEKVQTNDKRLDCSHLFHDECLQKIRDLHSGCVYCHF